MTTVLEDSFLLLDDGGLFLLDDGGYLIIDQQSAEVGGGQRWRVRPKPFFFLDELLKDEEEVFVLSEIE